MASVVFGRLPTGEVVTSHLLENDSGASVEILDYGAAVRTLRVPDREGRMADVVLGFGTLAPYLENRAYLGVIVGRIAGRVRGGRISVGGVAVQLPCNDGGNHLHGGGLGLGRRLWKAEPQLRFEGGSSIRLAWASPDGEDGYPGAVAFAVTYTLTDENALHVDTEAAAGQLTPASLTQHSYFNLAGEGSGDVRGHTVQIFANAFVPSDDGYALLDRLEGVSGTGADLRVSRPLGASLPGLSRGHGDLYLLPRAAEPLVAARIEEPRTGRVLEVRTDNPCLQFYTGAGLDGSLVGKSGHAYGPHAGLCLECQGYPQATTARGFGDILVAPGRPQLRRTTYAFTTR
jgi:aldose 1-epimerase